MGPTFALAFGGGEQMCCSLYSKNPTSLFVMCLGSVPRMLAEALLRLVDKPPEGYLAFPSFMGILCEWICPHV